MPGELAAEHSAGRPSAAIQRERNIEIGIGIYPPGDSRAGGNSSLKTVGVDTDFDVNTGTSDGRPGSRNIYSGTIGDFTRSVVRLPTLDAEVWLGSHPGQNRAFEKKQLLQQGKRPTPSIDPQEQTDLLNQCLLSTTGLSPTSD